jgi:hypothetical protein
MKTLVRCLAACVALVALDGCSNPGKDCCDCLIANGCWLAQSYACYYYYDSSYSGGKENPPPAQSWKVACQDASCTVCEQASNNFK